MRQRKGRKDFFSGGGDNVVSEGAKGGGEISPRQQSIEARLKKKLTTNEGVSLKYYRATGGDQVNFTVTQ